MNPTSKNIAPSKRYELWLGLVFGIALGLGGGIYLAPRISGESVGTESPHITSEKRVSLAADSSDKSADSPTTQDWFKRYAERFENAPENQPTPGLAEIMADALRPNSPFDLARTLVLIDMMRKEDFPVAFEILRNAQQPSLQRQGAFGEIPAVWIAFWERFGERDPAKALATALEPGETGPESRRIYVKQLFAGMVRRDPNEAVETYMAHPELRNRENAAEGLMAEWSKLQPKAAADWATQNLEGAERTKAFFALTWGMSGLNDIDASNAFLKTLPQGTDRASAMKSIRYQITKKPYIPAQQLLDFVAINRSLGARDRQFEAQMAARCTDNDPFAAANFFSQPLPDGSENDFAELKVVAAKWIQKDPKSALNWAKGEEGKPHYIVLAGEFARVAADRGDGAEKQQWLDVIEAQRKISPKQ